MLPGLCDGHVHLTFSAGPVPFRDLLHDQRRRLAAARGLPNARAALQAGVTTLRDLGSRGQVIYELRDAINKRIIPGPRVLSSGGPRSPAWVGICIFSGGWRKAVTVSPRMTEERVEEGADVIKVIATGGNMTTTSDPLKAQFHH